MHVAASEAAIHDLGEQRICAQSWNTQGAWPLLVGHDEWNQIMRLLILMLQASWNGNRVCGAAVHWDRISCVHFRIENTVESSVRWGPVICYQMF